MNENTENKTEIKTRVKRLIVKVWNGTVGFIKRFFSGTLDFLGLGGDNRFFRVLRYITAVSVTVIAVLMACGILISLGIRCYEKYERQWGEDYIKTRHISRNVTVYWRYKGNGYVKTDDGKTTIKRLKWVAESYRDTDSLVCYCVDNRRGYFNKNTGEVVIEPKYDHAWIFSEGLAAVDDNGWIKFIDSKGNVVIEPGMEYDNYLDGMTFSGGYCVIRTSKELKYGVLKTDGKWALEPEYDSIIRYRNLWIIKKDGKGSVLDKDFNTIIPYIDGDISVYGHNFRVTLNNHVVQLYNLRGELISDFCISKVEQMLYDTDEFRLINTEIYQDTEIVQKVARCRKYHTAALYCGLISPEGKILTQPVFDYIEAIGYDLYLCTYEIGSGVILNGRGEVVK